MVIIRHNKANLNVCYFQAVRRSGLIFTTVKDKVMAGLDVGERLFGCKERCHVQLAAWVIDLIFIFHGLLRVE